MHLQLFYAPQTCATVPYITLNEAGADFSVIDMNSRRGQLMSPEFLKLNPKHKVPVLVIDGEPLTENVAIQIWIARQFPQAKLLTADPRTEIKVISFLAWCASGIHPHLTPNARPGNYCDLPGSEESVKRVANVMLFEDLRVADEMLAGREWFFEHFTAADAYFFWCFRRAISFGLDIARYTHCHAHLERMQGRASVQRLIAHEKQVMAAFAAAA